MKVVIIKYNAGNIRSVSFALQRLGIEPIITDNKEEILSADKVIFPGVGEAGAAMKYLNDKNLDQVIVDLEQPVLGICLGMQLMCKHSEESNTNCLGIFETNVLKFSPSPDETKVERLKVPQIGWNTISALRSKLFDGIKENEYMYFVHSYYAELSAYTISLTNYGIDYSSALQKNNFYGVQFHPEKSATSGEMIIKNFLNL